MKHMEDTPQPKKRKRAVKKTSAKVKKEIAKAVDTIPTLLAKEEETRHKFPASPAGRQETKSAISDPYQAVRKKRRALWAGVGLVTAAVFGMWVWNVQTVFFDLRSRQSAEGKLLQNARQGIQQALAGAADDAQKKEMFEQKKIATQVKEILEQALTAAASPNSTTISAAATSSRPE